MKWTNSYRSFGLKTKRSTGLKTIEHKQAGASDVRRAVAGTVARVVHPSRRRRETTRQCGLADVQMAVPGVIAQKNMMRVSKVRCRDTLEILATCRARHASCKSWRLVFR